MSWLAARRLLGAPLRLPGDRWHNAEGLQAALAAKGEELASLRAELGAVQTQAQQARQQQGAVAEVDTEAGAAAPATAAVVVSAEQDSEASQRRVGLEETQQLLHQMAELMLSTGWLRGERLRESIARYAAAVEARHKAVIDVKQQRYDVLAEEKLRLAEKSGRLLKERASLDGEAKEAEVDDSA